MNTIIKENLNMVCGGMGDFDCRLMTDLKRIEGLPLSFAVRILKNYGITEYEVYSNCQIDEEGYIINCKLEYNF